MKIIFTFIIKDTQSDFSKKIQLNRDRVCSLLALSLDAKDEEIEKLIKGNVDWADSQEALPQQVLIDYFLRQFINERHFVFAYQCKGYHGTQENESTFVIELCLKYDTQEIWNVFLESDIELMEHEVKLIEGYFAKNAIYEDISEKHIIDYYEKRVIEKLNGEKWCLEYCEDGVHKEYKKPYQVELQKELVEVTKIVPIKEEENGI